MLACAMSTGPKEEILSDPQCQLVAAVLKRYIDERHEGVQRRAEVPLGCKAAYISQILDFQKRAGLDFLVALARETNGSVDQLLMLAPRQWREQPRIAALIAQGVQKYPNISRLAWDQVGSMSGPLSEGATVETLAVLALSWDSQATRDERKRAHDALDDREMAAQENVVRIGRESARGAQKRGKKPQSSS